MNTLRIVLLLLIIEGCTYKEHKVVNIAEGQAITAEGMFYVPSENIKLSISKDSGFLRIEASDSINNVYFKHEKPQISVFHNWNVSVDEYGNVWIKSSDVGTILWKKLSDKGYSMKYGENGSPELDGKSDLQGVWRLYNDEDVSFTIEKDSIYYFDSGQRYEYNTTGDSILIDYSTWVYSAKFVVDEDTLLIEDSTNRYVKAR